MQHDPAMRDCGGDRSTVLLGAASSISKLRVDDRDRQPPAIALAISSNFRSAASGVASGRSSLNFILAA